MMTARAAHFKFPEGFHADMPVKANRDYYRVNRKAAPNRVGRVLVATANPQYIRVQWNDCRHPHTVFIKLVSPEELSL